MSETKTANLPATTTPVTPEKSETREFRNDFDIAGLLGTAGKVILTEEQKKILYAPVNDEDVEIRPDGLIYLPWMEYVTRLNQAFGLEWALIPQGMPKVKGETVLWGFHLIVNGSLMGYAIGEQEYHPDNKKMAFGDCCEGAKSNALMRLCKGIGISLELWKPSFNREWKEKYAESYKSEKYGRDVVLWRRKEGNKTSSGGSTTTQETKEKEEQKTTTPQATPQEDKTKEAIKTLYDGLMYQYDRNKNVVRAGLEIITGKESFKELTLEEARNATELFQKFQVHALTCTKTPQDNVCEHACFYQEYPYIFCQGVVDKNFVCIFDKSTWNREVK
jgi:hypothetical protein